MSDTTPPQGRDPATPASPIRSRAKPLALLACLAAVCAGLWLGYGKSGAAEGPKKPPERKVPVRAETVSRKTARLAVSGLGTVTALNTASVRSRVDGELVAAPFKEGGFVQAGDPLATLDARPFEAQLAQAKGQLAKDKAQLANARLDLARYSALLADQALARQQYDSQKALVAQLEGAVKVDEAQIEQAKLQIGYCRILAPFSGRAGLRLVDPGSMVRAADQQGIVVLTQTKPIAVVFALPEAALPRVRERAKTERAPVEIFDRERKNRLGVCALEALDNQIDPAAGTFKVKALCDNADESLYPNQFVNAEFVVKEVENALAVPQTAIRRGQKGPFVYVLEREGEDLFARVRTAVFGEASGDATLVLSGLNEGESVVVDGAERLKDGAKVELKEMRKGS